MDTIDYAHDVMQVCRNGHIITDLLNTYPERRLSHCDRCGASTIERCLTCGAPLAGALPVPGLEPVGTPALPHYCSACGAAYPWTRTDRLATGPGALARLETMLRRFPSVVRELRSRHGQRPIFSMEDEHDLADLLRALLPLQFEDVRLENRTPSYSADSRTDFVLRPSGLVLISKRATPAQREPALQAQWSVDLEYYRQRGGDLKLVGFVYDPEQMLVEPERLETVWAALADDLCLHPIIAS
jgi:hypothetical protein